MKYKTPQIGKRTSRGMQIDYWTVPKSMFKNSINRLQTTNFALHLVIFFAGLPALFLFAWNNGHFGECWWQHQHWRFCRCPDPEHSERDCHQQLYTDHFSMKKGISWQLSSHHHPIIPPHHHTIKTIIPPYRNTAIPPYRHTATP